LSSIDDEVTGGRLEDHEEIKKDEQLLQNHINKAGPHQTSAADYSSMTQNNQE
jgi:hypothetical protein